MNSNEEIEDGMGFAGLVPTKAEQSAEDPFRCERAAYERLQSESAAEIARLNRVIQSLRDAASPATHNPQEDAFYERVEASVGARP